MKALTLNPELVNKMISSRLGVENFKPSDKKNDKFMPSRKKKSLFMKGKDNGFSKQRERS